MDNPHRITVHQANGQQIRVHCHIARRSHEWIVGLHGLQTDGRLFDTIFQDPQLQQYSHLAIDLIGFGASDKPTDFSYDLQDQAKMCAHILRSLKITNVHLIGHSMGGMIGTLLLASCGDSIQSFINMEGNLVLADCDASLQAIATVFEIFRHSHYPQLKQQLQHSPEPSALCRHQGLAQIPDYAYYQSAQSIVAWAKSGQLRDQFLHAPQRTLFIYGDHNHGKTDALTGSTVQRIAIPNAGHFMMFDNPPATLAAITQFL